MNICLKAWIQLICKRLMDKSRILKAQVDYYGPNLVFLFMRLRASKMAVIPSEAILLPWILSSRIGTF